MLAVTLMLISLTAALPSVYTAAQREKEEELIFRGNQYARAILMFRRQFGRLPTSTDELLKKTNGYRFLRQPFKDPMTKTGNWRFIHATGTGVIIDSVNTPVNPQTQGGILNPNSGTSGQPGNGTDSQNPSAGSTDQGSGSQSNQSAFSSQSAFSQMGGASIIGVASTSHKKSIRVWNNKDRYDQWEFLGVVQPGGGNGLPGQVGNPTGTGQNPGTGLGGNQQAPNMPPLVGPPSQQ